MQRILSVASFLAGIPERTPARRAVVVKSTVRSLPALMETHAGMNNQ